VGGQVTYLMSVVLLLAGIAVACSPQLDVDGNRFHRIRTVSRAGAGVVGCVKNPAEGELMTKTCCVGSCVPVSASRDHSLRIRRSKFRNHRA
jgi:hypothetical protein